MSELRLKKELFLLDNINLTVEAFSGLCKIEMSEQDDEYIFTFSNSRYDINETIMEFENYLIDLSFKNR